MRFSTRSKRHNRGPLHFPRRSRELSSQCLDTSAYRRWRGLEASSSPRIPKKHVRNRAPACLPRLCTRATTEIGSCCRGCSSNHLSSTFPCASLVWTQHHGPRARHLWPYLACAASSLQLNGSFRTIVKSSRDADDRQRGRSPKFSWHERPRYSPPPCFENSPSSQKTAMLAKGR